MAIHPTARSRPSAGTSQQPSVQHRILVVEDCSDLAEGLVETLELEGFKADAAPDGERALKVAKDLRPHLFLLDLTLPGMNGFEFLHAWRKRGRGEPIIVLSPRDEQLDKLRCFSLGADDYLTKPFDVLELLARVRAVLNRTSGPNAPTVLRFDHFSIDGGARIVTKAGKPVELSPLEFDLLLLLVKRAGTAVSRDELLKEIWHHKGRSNTRTVDTHVYALRQKLEPEPGRPRYIQSVRKVGYRFDP